MDDDAAKADRLLKEAGVREFYGLDPAATREEIYEAAREHYRAALLRDIAMFERRLRDEADMMRLSRQFEAEGDVENGEALWDVAQSSMNFANRMLKQLRGYLAELDTGAAR